jgi:hypothetical protein
VSVEAICWALNLAPVPVGRGGQPSTACEFVLAGLANHAGPAGRTAHGPPERTALAVAATAMRAARGRG